MTSDTVTAIALDLGLGVTEMDCFTVGGIIDLQTETVWRKNPKLRIYEATQEDFDAFANL